MELFIIVSILSIIATMNAINFYSPSIEKYVCSILNQSDCNFAKIVITFATWLVVTGILFRIASIIIVDFRKHWKKRKGINNVVRATDLKNDKIEPGVYEIELIVDEYVNETQIKNPFSRRNIETKLVKLLYICEKQELLEDIIKTIGKNYWSKYILRKFISIKSMRFKS